MLTEGSIQTKKEELSKRKYGHQQENVYEGVFMQKDQTFTVVVSTYMKKYIESELYKRIKEDIQAYEVLWEVERGNGDSVRR